MNEPQDMEILETEILLSLKRERILWDRKLHIEAFYGSLSAEIITYLFNKNIVKPIRSIFMGNQRVGN